MKKFPLRDRLLKDRLRRPGSQRPEPGNTPAASNGTDRIAQITPTLLNASAPVVFTAEVLMKIEKTVGSLPAETGGPLGGTRGSGGVEHFHLDETSARTAVTYYPDYKAINTLMRMEWNPAGINLLGFIHSHPKGAVRPSRPDLDYATRILAGIPELDRLLLPIAQTKPDTGEFSLRGYAAVRDGSGVKLDDIDVIVLPGHSPSLDLPPEFDRVRDAYDMNVMTRARVVAIGCGGSASFLEDMARAGLAEFVLVDPDVVEATNVATQQAYRSDIGSPKVDVIAKRLVDINPHARVWTVQAKLEALSDSAVRRLTVGWLPGSAQVSPSATILGAFTDNFDAQARVHRLGLHLGIPVIGGTVYFEGRGIELTFSAPEVTRACIRCVQRSRYVAYLENGYRNTVGSAGAPIMATARLNALKLPIAFGLLHQVSRTANPEHPATQRYRRLLSSVAHSNLVLASLDPDIHETLGLSAFSVPGLEDGSRIGLDVDRTLWRPQEPDNPTTGYPECPDCGGTGDLSTSIGQFISTVPIPRFFGDHRRAASKAPVPATQGGERV
jgi:proteasome lid subunit RPN8/RPN11